MHMPTKMGVLVLVLLAACVGTYYDLVVQSEHVGDWRVYQGSGRIACEQPGNVQFLDVNYTEETSAARFVFDVNRNGPVFGLTLHF